MLAPGRLQGRGQALFSSLTFGAGTALGSYLAGQIWDAVAPVAIWGISIAAATAGLMFVRRSGAMRRDLVEGWHKT